METEQSPTRSAACGSDSPAPAFYQVNHAQAERLYEKAAALAGLTGEETVLDLYCGTGTITLCLARHAKKAVGVEIIPQAIEDAKFNAAQNGMDNAEFYCMDAGAAAKLLAERGEKPDVIVVDPPRKGRKRRRDRGHRRHAAAARRLRLLRPPPSPTT